MTGYVILRHIEPGTWEPLSEQNATGALQAVRQHVRDMLAEGESELIEGEYVAIPTRSWNRYKVEHVHTSRVIATLVERDA